MMFSAEMYTALTQMSESDLKALLDHLQALFQDMERFPKDADGQSITEASSLRHVLNVWIDYVAMVYVLSSEPGFPGWESISDDEKKEAE